MPGRRNDYLKWDESFMGLALLMAGRTKDPSTFVGACIVKDNKVLSIGYNGLTRGMDDEDFYWNSIGEQTGEYEKVKDPYVVHAERNAIYNYRGCLQDLEGSTLFVTFFPCNECIKSIIQVGVKRIVWLRMYSKQENVGISKKMLEAAGVEVVEYCPQSNLSKTEVQEATEDIQKIVKRFSPKLDQN